MSEGHRQGRRDIIGDAIGRKPELGYKESETKLVS
jgi:hypothetical protein